MSNQDPGTKTYWMIYDKATGKPIPLGVDSYKPQDDSTTIFRLVTGASHEETTTSTTATSPTELEPSSSPGKSTTASPTELEPSSSPGKFGGVGLVTICLLAGIEALLFF